MIQFKGFKPEAEERIARMMGYSGDMNGFATYLAQNPDKQEMMNQYKGMAINMLKKVKGILPGNGETELEIRMLDIPGSIGMKGIVLGERYKEKDAYDIYSVVSRCHDGPISVARILKPFIEEGSMRAGINVIRNKFRDIRAEGPSWVATFMSGDPTEQDRIKAEVFVKMSAFIKTLFGED